MIAAKEKAKELVDKFLPILFGVKPLYKKSDYFKAKQCALIAVDEILEASLYQFDEMDKYVIYWQQVKQEIELL